MRSGLRRPRHRGIREPGPRAGCGAALATFAFREVVRRLVSREVTDTQCGLKLFSRRAALEIFARATIDGFAFDAEVVMLTHRLGLPFRRVPVTLINEFASTLSLRRNALPMLLDVMRLRLRDRAGRGAQRRTSSLRRRKTRRRTNAKLRRKRNVVHRVPCPRLPWACAAIRPTCRTASVGMAPCSGKLLLC